MGCYIWYSEDGTGRGRSPPRSLLAVANVTAHPSTTSVPITVCSNPLLCGFNVSINGYNRLTGTVLGRDRCGSIRPFVVRHAKWPDLLQVHTTIFHFRRRRCACCARHCTFSYLRCLYFFIVSFYFLPFYAELKCSFS